MLEFLSEAFERSGAVFSWDLAFYYFTVPDFKQDYNTFLVNHVFY